MLPTGLLAVLSYNTCLVVTQFLIILSRQTLIKGVLHRHAYKQSDRAIFSVEVFLPSVSNLYQVDTV